MDDLYVRTMRQSLGGIGIWGGNAICLLNWTNSSFRFPLIIIMHVSLLKWETITVSSFSDKGGGKWSTTSHLRIPPPSCLFLSGITLKVYPFLLHLWDGRPFNATWVNTAKENGSKNLTLKSGGLTVLGEKKNLATVKLENK